MEEVQTLLDPRVADVRLEFGIARAEVAHAAIARAQAEQMSAIVATLREAREFPPWRWKRTTTAQAAVCTPAASC